MIVLGADVLMAGCWRKGGQLILSLATPTPLRLGGRVSVPPSRRCDPKGCFARTREGKGDSALPSPLLRHAPAIGRVARLAGRGV
jgi:hypothetical protein